MIIISTINVCVIFGFYVGCNGDLLYEVSSGQCVETCSTCEISTGGSCQRFATVTGKDYCDVLTDSAIKTVSNEAPRCRCLSGIACILHTGHINTQQLQLFHQQMMIVTDL